MAEYNETAEDEFEEADELQDDSVYDENLDGDSSEEEQEEASEKKNKNKNFVKRLREENRALKKALKEKDTKEVPIDNDTRFFFIENPEAKEYKDKMLELKSNPKYENLDLEDLLELAKIKTPKQSQTKKDFDFKSKSKPADLLSLDDDEAAETLSASEYLKYSRLKQNQFLTSSPRKIK